MSEFTPGPWISTSSGRIVKTDTDTRNLIADCWFSNKTNAEMQANARLIASAPDLLAACESAYAACPLTYDADGLADQLLAAITKAKGA